MLKAPLSVSAPLIDAASKLERQRTRDSLAHSIKRRPAAEELQSRNVLKAPLCVSAPLIDAVARLNKQFAIDVVAKSLGSRPAAEELEERGILRSESEWVIV